jgi:hypothetical protein
MLRRNKKGNLMDWFIIIPMLIIVAVFAVACLLVTNKVKDSGVFDSDTDATSAINQSQSGLLSLDNMFLFMIIGLSLFTLASAAMVWNHPAFFFISFFLLCIAVTVAGTVSNAYDDFANADTITTTSAHYPKTDFVMDNLPFLVGAMGVAVMVVMYVAYTKGV